MRSISIMRSLSLLPCILLIENLCAQQIHNTETEAVALAIYQPPFETQCAACYWSRDEIHTEAEERRRWAAREKNMDRHDPSEGLWFNSVRCWPSVGGIIIAETLAAVEFEFLGVDRFYAELPSLGAIEEDSFCRKLRMVGGRWWRSYYDFSHATGRRRRLLYPDEQELLLMGWPKDGGVWVLQYKSRKDYIDYRRPPIGSIHNALNMEERCLAIELSGGTFFQDPKESIHVRPLLEGFGNREEKEALFMVEELETNYFWS